ncbi:hypothetical protein ES703_89785 [subsurface metagenome]
MQIAESDKVATGKRDNLDVHIIWTWPSVRSGGFEGLIDDHSTAVLFNGIEAAVFDVSIRSPARDTVTRCIFIDGEEELRFAGYDCFGLDLRRCSSSFSDAGSTKRLPGLWRGLDVWYVLLFRDCLIHIGVIGRRGWIS